MKKEFNFKGAKRGPRHDPKTTKISKTFRLDYDVFEWLLKEADRTGIPYQTLMNSKLKMLMTQEQGQVPVTAEQVREIVREEIGKAS